MSSVRRGAARKPAAAGERRADRPEHRRQAERRADRAEHSGTANVEALMIDMRTPAASPICPAGAMLCSSDITIGCAAAERQPQRERQRHQRAGAARRTETARRWRRR